MIEISESDKSFYLITAAADLPRSFLIETRAKRLGCSKFDLERMRSFDLNRELADEAAIASFGLNHFLNARPIRLDDRLLDSIARRESSERGKAFEQWLNERSGR